MQQFSCEDQLSSSPSTFTTAISSHLSCQRNMIRRGHRASVKSRAHTALVLARDLDAQTFIHVAVGTAKASPSVEYTK